jgi:hypothetical protein
VFSKIVPIISIWELKVGFHPKHALTPQQAEEEAGLWRARP